MKRTRALLPAVAVALLAPIVAARAENAQSAGEEPGAASASEAATRPEGAPAAAAGLVATIDPATGELVVGGEGIPDEVMAEPALADALSTSSEGLVAVELPDGRGVMIHLQGRFQNVLFAAVDAGGQLRVGHQAPRRVVVPEGEGPSCPDIQPESDGGHHERD